MQFMAEEEGLVNPKKQSLDPSDLPSKLTASLVDEDERLPLRMTYFQWLCQFQGSVVV